MLCILDTVVQRHIRNCHQNSEHLQLAFKWFCPQIQSFPRRYTLTSNSDDNATKLKWGKHDRSFNQKINHLRRCLSKLLQDPLNLSQLTEDYYLFLYHENQFHFVSSLLLQRRYVYYFAHTIIHGSVGSKYQLINHLIWLSL